MSSIFIAKTKLNGHSWSIVAKLGDILKDAERRFGRRDTSYTLLGVEVSPNSTPFLVISEEHKQVIMQISSGCIMDFNRAIFQISHGVIHLLSPTEPSLRTVLEEGLAAYYSLEYSKENGLGEWIITEAKQKAVASFMQELLSIDHDIIRKLRVEQPVLSKISREQLIKVAPTISSELAEKLCIRYDDFSVKRN